MVWLQADGNHEQALDLEEAALLHYIRHGFAEGRTDDPLDGEGPEEPEEPEGPDEPEDGEPEGAMETAGAADFLLW